MFEATQGESPGETTPTADALESSLAQVVELARAGDGLAFRDLFQRYNGTLYQKEMAGNCGRFQKG